MNRAAIVVIGLVAVAATAAAAFVALQPSPEDRLASACESILAERLAAPSTYSRLEVRGWVRAPAKRDEFLKIDTPALRDHVADLSRSDPAYAKVRQRLEEIFDERPTDRVSGVIRYEATDALGIRRQSASVCAMFLPAGDPLDPRPLSDVRVDNMTALDWNVAQVIRLSQ